MARNRGWEAAEPRLWPLLNTKQVEFERLPYLYKIEMVKVVAPMAPPQGRLLSSALSCGWRRSFKRALAC